MNFFIIAILGLFINCYAPMTLFNKQGLNGVNFFSDASNQSLSYYRGDFFIKARNATRVYAMHGML
jgi:hypothetical protein